MTATLTEGRSLAPPAKLSAIDQAIADMPRRVAELLARFAEQDRQRGFSFPSDYLWTAKVPDGSSPAESRARFETDAA